jgi:hypothetical protein
MTLKDQNTLNNYRAILIKEQTAGTQNTEQNEQKQTELQALNHRTLTKINRTERFSIKQQNNHHNTTLKMSVRHSNTTHISMFGPSNIVIFRRKCFINRWYVVNYTLTSVMELLMLFYPYIT